MIPLTGQAVVAVAAAPVAAASASAGGQDSTMAETEEETSLSDPEDFAPLTKGVIDEFTQGALSGCLALLDTLPDTIYRVCDLMLAVFARNGADFKEQVCFNRLSPGSISTFIL